MAMHGPMSEGLPFPADEGTESSPFVHAPQTVRPGLEPRLVAMDGTGAPAPFLGGHSPALPAPGPVQRRWSGVAVVASIAIGVVALERQQVVLFVAALMAFQMALGGLIRTFQRREDSGPGMPPGRKRRSGAWIARLESWLLVESLVDMASTKPRLRSRPGHHFAVISRRNRAALELFASAAEASAALDGVVRRWPSHEGRFAVVRIIDAERSRHLAEAA